MKREMGVFFVFCLLSISFVSAGLFSDIWGRFTGEVVSDSCVDDYGSYCVYNYGSRSVGQLGETEEEAIENAKNYFNNAYVSRGCPFVEEFDFEDVDCYGGDCIGIVRVDSLECPGHVRCDGSCALGAGECLSQYSYSCYNGDVWWYDSCGELGDLKESCDYGCSGDSCDKQVCISNSSYSCYNGDVWWYDSCGELGDLKEGCDYGCSDGECEEESCDEDYGDSCTYLIPLPWSYGYGDTEEKAMENARDSFNEKYYNCLFEDESLEKYSFCFVDGEWYADIMAKNLECNGYIDCDGDCVSGTTDKCVSQSSYSCYNDDVYWYDSCGELGDLKEGCDYGCSDGECEDDQGDEGEILEGNLKNMDFYSDGQVFLVSDEDWHDVLPFVSASVWTRQSGDLSSCVEGYGTADGVCVYPMLIFHEEDEEVDTSNPFVGDVVVKEAAFDADSIIYFMQQYDADEVRVVGESPVELDELLVAERDFGAGVDEGSVKRVGVDDYLLFWESFEDVVLVEDDYASALIASTYASLLNVPLVVEGSVNDVDEVFEGRNVICVGHVGDFSVCDVSYSVEELRGEYVEETGTDKVVLVNSEDLGIWEDDSLSMERSSGSVEQLYSKLSLSSPFLASAKHEVLLSVTDGSFEFVDEFVEEQVELLMPDLMESEDAVEFDAELYALKKISLSSEEEEVLFRQSLSSLDYYYDKEGGRIFFITEHDDLVVCEDLLCLNAEVVIDNVKYADLNGEDFLILREKDSKLGDYEMFYLRGGEEVVSFDYSKYFYPSNLHVSDDYVVWVEKVDYSCRDSGVSCDVTDSVCDRGDVCVVSNEAIYFLNKDTGEKELIAEGSIGGVSLVGDDLFYVVEGDSSGDIYRYNFISETIDVVFSVSGDMRESRAIFSIEEAVFTNGEDVFFLGRSGENDYEIYSYDSSSGEVKLFYSDSNYRGGMIFVNSDEVFVQMTNKDTSYYYMNVLDINSGGVVRVVEDIYFSAEGFVDDDGNCYYFDGVYDVKEFVSGYLTIIGGDKSILLNKEEGYKYVNSDIRYADIYNLDYLPDLAVGRIQGITVSDASSYIARVLFYDSLRGTEDDKVSFILGNGVDDHNGALDGVEENLGSWVSVFEAFFFDASCVVRDNGGSLVMCASYSGSNKTESYQEAMRDEETVYLAHHGSYSMAGIGASVLPWLDLPFFISNSCSTCERNVDNSFCNNLIRRGAIGNVAAVETTYSSSYRFFVNMLDGLYAGDSFSVGTIFSVNYGVYTSSVSNVKEVGLFGDPTLKLDYGEINEELEI